MVGGGHGERGAGGGGESSKVHHATGPIFPVEKAKRQARR